MTYFLIPKCPSPPLFHENAVDQKVHPINAGRLEAGAEVAHRLLKDLPKVFHTDDTETPLLLIDTAGCDCLESIDQAGSRANEGVGHPGKKRYFFKRSVWEKEGGGFLKSQEKKNLKWGEYFLIFLSSIRVDKFQTTAFFPPSKKNYVVQEADLVARHLHKLITSGLADDQIGVITPYNAQVT